MITTLHFVLCVWQYGVAPIHLAAWFGSLEILKLLVQAGAEQKVENEVKKQEEFCFYWASAADIET